MTIDTKRLWEEVKENSHRLEGCKRHRFEGGALEKLGQRYRCLDCKGQMGLTDIGSYISGYEAGGGDCNDVWPGYRDRFAK